MQLLELRSVAEYRARENCQKAIRWYQLESNRSGHCAVAGLDYIGLMRNQGFIKKPRGLVGLIGAESADRQIHSPF
jgi:hypothetical protein